MASAGDLFTHGLPEVGGAGKLHVLAVDDSHVDRKVIERLLKISSCKGKELKMLNLSVFCCSFSIGFWWLLDMGSLAVTVVESGSRALQYLGLDGEKSSIGFDVRKLGFWIVKGTSFQVTRKWSLCCYLMIVLTECGC